MEFIELLKELIPNLPEQETFSPRKKEDCYRSAYSLYQTGDYTNGANLFIHLLLHDPYDVRFWKGLASCHQMQCQYKEALRAWAVASLLDDNSSQAHFHAAECYLSLKDKEEALKALTCAKHFLRANDPLHEKLTHLTSELCHG